MVGPTEECITLLYYEYYIELYAFSSVAVLEACPIIVVYVQIL